MSSKISKKIKTSFLISAMIACGSGFIYSDTTHVVQKGETLYSISRKYNSTIQSISEANKIDGTGIKVGQKLIIPGITPSTASATASKTADQEKKPAVAKTSEPVKNGTYTVQKGDTWYGIARSYSINVNELFALNKTDGSASLKAGQKIVVPGNKVASTTTPSTVKKESVTLPTAPLIDTHTYSTKKGDPNLVWPVEKPEVAYVNGKVSGVSLSAKKDESVSAIKSGTVMFSGTYRGFGNVVFIQSKTGHIYAYTGLGKVLVSKGEYINYKSQIGTAGIDSYSSKSQINLMVFQNGLPIDPAKAPRG